MAPGGIAISKEFGQFEHDLPVIVGDKRLETHLQGFGTPPLASAAQIFVDPFFLPRQAQLRSQVRSLCLSVL